MKQINFYLPIFDWEITIVTIYNKEDKAPLEELLRQIEAEPKGAIDVLNLVERGAMNGGDTWRDTENRRILVILYPWKDEATFYEVLNHEKRHIVDRICEHHCITDIETPAYIDGYISSIIYSRLNELK